MKRTIIILIVLAIIAAIAWRTYSADQSKAEPSQTPGDTSLTVQTVATQLDTPWNIVFLPSGDMLVSERNGTLRVIGNTNASIQVPGVAESGEGGHLGIALHPQYAQNNWLYIYFTTMKNGNRINQVMRYVFDGKTLSDAKVIIDNIPGASNHNGGAISFGPDNMLYVTTGDAGTEDAAQDTASLAGKILRVQDDGSIPSDNPFGTAVYSYGHRNPQGLAWDAQGGLWSSEHGRSGVRSGFDEINYIEKGANYGWPVIQGDETKEGMKVPALHSGANTTWAPASLTYKDGSLFFSGLRGATLYEVAIASSDNVAGKLGALKEHFKGQYGRLRATAVDASGILYVSTSNKDGRGNPADEDDRIFKVMR